MSFAILALTVMWFTSGLLLLHWLALSLVSLVMTIVYLTLTRWDLLLLPRWLAVLAVYQLSYFAGAATRLWWDNRAEKRG